MTHKKTNEQGSVMIEVIAILALLGIMAPMLIRQISQRSQEVDNVNMASEIRTIAEAVDAYMQADRSLLQARCPVAEGGNIVECTSNPITATELSYFVPNGFQETLEDYNYVTQGYWLEANLAPRPVYQTFIVPKDNIIPSNFNLKRAARVASMIGVNGGIYDKVANPGSISGTGGAWEDTTVGSSATLKNALNDATGHTDATFLAMVTLTSFIPEVYVEAENNKIAAPEDIAFGRLHAYQYFSVGRDGNKCFVMNRTTDGSGNAISDTIYNPGVTASGQTDPCDPLFWVGRSGGGVDTSESGQVYVKNNLYVGRNNTENRSAVAIEGGDSDDEDNRIVVYDLTGRERVLIDGSGKIVLTNDYSDEEDKKEIIIQDGTIRSNKMVDTYSDAPDMAGLTDDKKYYQVNLDKDGVSVLHDVRLVSRGGARLSEILPNYISKGVYTIETSGNSSVYTTTIKKPSCAVGYTPAIIITPTRWDSTRVQEIRLDHTHSLDRSTLQNVADQLYVNAPTGGGTANVQVRPNAYAYIPEETITVVASMYEQEYIRQDKARFVVLIDNTDTGFSDNNDPYKSNNPSWEIKLGYKRANEPFLDNSKWNGGAVEDSITAIAQTYCVYMNASFENRP
ncbi:MAG: hypothetical protein LBU87_05345 [Lactobacillales bacterium]|jgi:type II secretory pathway pseudopilin PulG|nr:hypothetical protein [Lactobacillales bacterium]